MEIARQAEVAVQRLLAGDEPGFHRAIAEAQRGLPCADAPLGEAQAAVWHRAMAVQLFVEKDLEGAKAELRAALAAGPEGELPSALAHAVPALAELQRQARSSPQGANVAAPTREGVTLRVDGRAALTLPADRPYILQVLSAADGAPRWTGYLTGGVPDLARVLPPPPQAPLCPDPTAHAHVCAICPPPPPAPEPPSRLLVAGSVASTALAAGLYVGSVLTNQRFWDPETPEAELEGLQARANALQGGAIGVGVLALGLDVWLGVDLARAFRDGP